MVWRSVKSNNSVTKPGKKLEKLGKQIRPVIERNIVHHCKWDGASWTEEAAVIELSSLSVCARLPRHFSEASLRFFGRSAPAGSPSVIIGGRDKSSSSITNSIPTPSDGSATIDFRLDDFRARFPPEITPSPSSVGSTVFFVLPIVAVRFPRGLGRVSSPEPSSSICGRPLPLRRVRPRPAKRRNVRSGTANVPSATNEAVEGSVYREIMPLKFLCLDTIMTINY